MIYDNMPKLWVSAVTFPQAGSIGWMGNIVTVVADYFMKPISSGLDECAGKECGDQVIFPGTITTLASDEGKPEDIARLLRNSNVQAKLPNAMGIAVHVDGVNNPFDVVNDARDYLQNQGYSVGPSVGVAVGDHSRMRTHVVLPIEQ
ncbi:hypothetical protein CMO88_04855 [Candidatus Woesearchaeota archaeon]|nr:hypothetical protein [Candidatus Woesearchaeota archaeon]|tara:strand:+ start:7349 stop:7789 length:441 start_codon:yes stop_codon:yes gene_type:complete